MPHVIAYDFEAAGGVPSVNGFTRLGAALLNLETGEVVSTFDEYASMRKYDWNSACCVRFWDKHRELYKETLKKTAESKSSPYEVVEHFLTWVEEVSKPFLSDIYLISDNLGFDGGLLKAFCKRDVLYIFGEYREMVDVSSAYIGMAHCLVDTKAVNDSAKALALNGLNKHWKLSCPEAMDIKYPSVGVIGDHNPVNDSIAMALYWHEFHKRIKLINSDSLSDIRQDSSLFVTKEDAGPKDETGPTEEGGGNDSG